MHQLLSRPSARHWNIFTSRHVTFSYRLYWPALRYTLEVELLVRLLRQNHRSAFELVLRFSKPDESIFYCLYLAVLYDPWLTLWYVVLKWQRNILPSDIVKQIINKKLAVNKSSLNAVWVYTILKLCLSNTEALAIYFIQPYTAEVTSL